MKPMYIDKKIMTECPLCHKKQSFRRNGSGRYFCSECFIETQIIKGELRIFTLTADGNAILIKKTRVG
jgi:ribosomal protein L37AE/L43A